MKGFLDKGGASWYRMASCIVVDNHQTLDGKGGEKGCHGGRHGMVDPKYTIVSSGQVERDYDPSSRMLCESMDGSGGRFAFVCRPCELREVEQYRSAVNEPLILGCNS